MDVAKVDESIFAAGDAKLHGGMCRMLSAIVCKVLGIFPVLEASRPRSKLGIQALCSLHVALEKAKNLLQHCSDCSKFYLAITGESVLLKFEKARCSLMDSLRRVDDIVPQAIGCQILEIVYELEGTVFSLDSSEKQVGDEVIVLLQQDRDFSSNCYERSELETFHQASLRLGITSSRAALRERRALKKLIERARAEEDKRKESIVSYFLHLMRKYSKLFRNEFSEDNDSQGSSPRSPTVQASYEECDGTGGNDQAFYPQLSKLNIFNFSPSDRRSVQIPVPPEELRCPISLQLMYDPVIISSGQTYERVCIEKWFSDEHNTCPKTQQQLNHLCLTPNYCVKGLVSSWCEQNGVPVPDSPPDSFDTNYWGLIIPECESADSISMGSINSYEGVKVVPLEEDDILKELEGNGMGGVPEEARGGDIFERYKSLLTILGEGEDLDRQCEVVKQIRLFLKVDEEARMFMGANGFVEALVKFLILAIYENNVEAQEIGAMALFNLAVNNNRNNMMMLSAGLVPVMEDMILNLNCYKSATALYLNLSFLEEARPIIGSSQAVPFLVKVLQADCESQCQLDALDTLYNLSADSSNTRNLLSAGIIEGLQVLLTSSADGPWVEKSIAVIINLASSKFGKEEIISSPALITGLAIILDTGEIIEQEQAVSCLWLLCHRNEKCCDMLLREGVIPALVSISVTGTTKGKDKAQRLLMLFREQRQRDPSSEYVQQQQQQQQCESTPEPVTTPESKPPCKSASKKMGRALNSILRSKHLSVYQCQGST